MEWSPGALIGLRGENHQLGRAFREQSRTYPDMFGGWQRDCLLASHQAAPQGGVAQRKRRLRASMAWLTVQEAADLLRVPVSWLYERTRTNSVPHVKLGKYLRFDRDELVAWVDELRRDGRGPRALRRTARPVIRAEQR